MQRFRFGLNHLGNSDLVVKKIYSFLRQNVDSKFLVTLDKNSICCRRGIHVVKNAKKVS